MTDDSKDMKTSKDIGFSIHKLRIYQIRKPTNEE